MIFRLYDDDGKGSINFEEFLVVNYLICRYVQYVQYAQHVQCVRSCCFCDFLFLRLLWWHFYLWFYFIFNTLSGNNSFGLFLFNITHSFYLYWYVSVWFCFILRAFIRDNILRYTISSYVLLYYTILSYIIMSHLTLHYVLMLFQLFKIRIGGACVSNIREGYERDMHNWRYSFTRQSYPWRLCKLLHVSTHTCTSTYNFLFFLLSVFSLLIFLFLVFLLLEIKRKKFEN